MDLNTIFQSKEFRVILWSLVGLIGVFAIFEAGVIVGYKKGTYAYRWEQHYEQNFGGPKGGLPLGDQHTGLIPGLRNASGNDIMGAHGISGSILKIDGSTVVIRGKDDVEKIIQIDDDALIKRFHDAIHLADLKVNDMVVVIGDSDDLGKIEAKFIRVMQPAPIKIQSAPQQ